MFGPLTHSKTSGPSSVSNAAAIAVSQSPEIHSTSTLASGKAAAYDCTASSVPSSPYSWYHCESVGRSPLRGL